MQILIQGNGALRCVYDEAIDLTQFGLLKIKRGSYVEPDDHGSWTADLSVLNGPALGPFRLRSEALNAERQWLESHWLLSSNT